MDLLGVCRCVPGIFQYVRKPYNDCAHHALDVFCMYSILLGGEVNVLMYDKLFPEKEKAELSANADEAKN